MIHRILQTSARLLAAWIALSSVSLHAQSLYIHWRPGADAYDTLSVTVNLVTDSTSPPPDGNYTFRSE